MPPDSPRVMVQTCLSKSAERTRFAISQRAQGLREQGEVCRRNQEGHLEFMSTMTESVAAQNTTERRPGSIPALVHLCSLEMSKMGARSFCRVSY